jgi:hypothetical protein
MFMFFLMGFLPRRCVFVKSVRVSNIWLYSGNFFILTFKILSVVPQQSLTSQNVMQCKRLTFLFCSKVKCNLVQALSLCTSRTAHRGSRGIALPFLDHSTRRRWEFSVTPRPLFTPGTDPLPIVQKAGWAPGQVWTGAENLHPHWGSIHGPSSP